MTYCFRPPRLKNVDRSTARSMEVTVGNVTVVITDYQPKKVADNKHLPNDSKLNGAHDSMKSSKNETVVNGEIATMDES